MTDPKHPELTQTRLVAGIWEGVLSGAAGLPMVEALHQGVRLDGLTVTPLPGQPGQQMIKLPIPAAVLSEGVQTILLTVAGEVLAQVTIIAGVPLEDDLRAEIGLLRAELDLLKRAFQRQSRTL